MCLASCGVNHRLPIRFLDSGEAISALTETDPADSPAMVNSLRVTAKGSDILLHPTQSRRLIQEAIVA